MHSTRFIDEPHICQACFYLNMRSHNRLHNTRAFPSTTTPNQAQAQVCNYIPFCTSDMGPPVPQPQSALKSCAFTYLLTQHTWVPQHHNPKSSSSHVPLRTCLHSTRGFPSTTTPKRARVRATFNRRGSPKKPTLCCSLERTHDSTMTSFSRPCTHAHTRTHTRIHTVICTGERLDI